MRLGAAAFACVLLLSGALAGCTQPVPVGAVDLRIGAILPLDESSERALAPAFDLAVRQVNDGGYNVKLTVDKERVIGGDVRGAYDRLVSRGSIAIVDLRGPAEAQTLAERSVTSGKALLLLPAVTSVTTQANSPVFRVFVDPAGEGNALATLASNTGAKKFAVIREESEYGVLVARAVENKLGDAVVSSTSYPVDNTRVATQRAADVCGQGAEAVIFVGYPGDVVRALEGLQPCRSNLRVFASSAVANLEVTAGSADGLLVKGITGVALQSASPLVFGSLYRNVYETSPPPFAAGAYDSVNSLALAALAARPVQSGQTTVSTSPLSAAELRTTLASVTTAPGIRFSEFGLAATAARAGDEIEWRGYSRDASPTQAYVMWRLGEDARPIYETATI